MVAGAPSVAAARPGPVRAAALWLVTALAVAALYWPTWRDMVGIWWHASTFNHCFLIPLISAWLVWERRAVLAALPSGVAWRGVAFVAANALLWVLGELAGVALAQHLAVVGMVIGTAWAFIGDARFRAVRFPLLYLYFAVPAGEFLVPHLQEVTADIAVAMIRMTGIPVLHEGLYITLPGSRFVVAEACSGINYLIAGLAIGTVFAWYSYRSRWRLAAFAVLMVLVPVLANGVRAFGIIMISHLSGHRLAAGVDHFIYGWVFFGVVAALLFFVGGLFADRRREDQPPAARVPDSVATGGPLGPAVLALLAATALGPVVAHAVELAPPAPPAVALPRVVGWQGPEPAVDVLGARFRGAAQVATVRYTRDDGVVQLELAYFPRERQGAEAVSSVNRAYDWRHWRPLVRGRAQAPLGGGLEVAEARLGEGAGGWLVWHWYDVHGRRAAEPWRAKLLGLVGKVVLSPIGSAVVVLSTPLGDGEDAARARLSAFLAAADLRLEALRGQP